MLKGLLPDWVFSLFERGLFLLDLSSIFYFNLAPALNYWIFQGSTISLDLWDETEWQAWLITMYLSLWHQTFKKVKEELPCKSRSLTNNFYVEAEFILASPTHSSMNSCLYLERVGITPFCCTSKIRGQKHRATVPSVSSYCPWIKTPSCLLSKASFFYREHHSPEVSWAIITGEQDTTGLAVAQSPPSCKGSTNP